MRSKLVIIMGLGVFLIGALVAGCTRRENPKPASEPRPGGIADAVDPADLTPEEKVQWGQSMFGAMCGSCHGEDGRGGAASSLARPEVRENYPTEADLVRRIKEGDPGAGMPPCATDLGEGELSALAAYVFSLSE